MHNLVFAVKDAMTHEASCEFSDLLIRVIDWDILLDVLFLQLLIVLHLFPVNFFEISSICQSLNWLLILCFAEEELGQLRFMLSLNVSASIGTGHDRGAAGGCFEGFRGALVDRVVSV